MTEQNKQPSQPFAWYWYDQHGCLYITGDDRKPDLPADAQPLYAAEQTKQSDTPAPAQQLMGDGAVSIDLMQRIWANLYYDEEEAGCTFQSTLDEVVNWLSSRDALPEGGKP